MSTNTVRQHHTKRNPKHTCALCGRPTETGKHVEGIGTVGPECHTKVAGLQRVLEHYRLHPLANGPRTYDMRESTNAHGDPVYVPPESVQIARGLAQNSPFMLLETPHYDTDPPSVTIRLVARRSPAARRTIRRRFKQLNSA